jgi:RNA polymerase sigma factor (sigma-70 family)
MMINTIMNAEGTSDTALVAQTLAGDRDAFGQIVSRYQSLICSLAYSATGSLGQSQDLAQETFITAWKHLRLLREREKLRAWLCGIARCLIGKARRRDGHEPIHAAAPLDAVDETEATEALPSERLMTAEEEAILWRSIERIPQIYREPLVLFYREHQSIERVAAALDLSQDAVKQRLSRGRKLLHQEVLAFVEGALQRSAPGAAFTVGVLAALPVFTTSASAAALGVTAAKSGVTTKAGAFLASATPLVGAVAGFSSAYLGYRISLARAASDQERHFIKRFYAMMTLFVVLPLALVFLAIAERDLAESHPGLFAGAVLAIATTWIPAVGLLLLWTKTALRKLQQRETRSDVGDDVRSPFFRRPAKSKTRVFEYRSRACLFGLPLVHIRFGGTWANMQDTVKAWFALGDCAVGVIFAFGGMSLAPISIGGFALGGVVFGGFGGGVLCYAGFAFGVWVVGGIITGVMAVGGCAFGWKAALGGLAVAREFALGGVAIAQHANDGAANTFIRNQLFFQNAFAVVTKWLLPTALLAVVPSLFIWRVTKKSESKG